MGTKKIALIIFLIALILLSIGFVIFATRNSKNSLNPGALNQSAIQENLDNQVPDNPAKEGPAAHIQFTDEQIEQKIEEKKQIISEQAKDRPFTDDELYFLSFPEEAAVEELKRN